MSGPAKIYFIFGVLMLAAQFLSKFMRMGKVMRAGLMAILVVAVTAGPEK